MKPRKTLEQMAHGDTQPQSIAGKPADVCPYCGCAMFVAKTQTLQTRVQRYVVCRNNNCGKRFVSTQPQPKPPAPTILREVGVDDEGDVQNLLLMARAS